MTERPLWLNLGSSSRTFPDMINVDRDGSPGTLVKDLRLGLPFPAGCAEVVVASHVLEHLNFFEELPVVLGEIHRVLAPGGLLRLAVPDLELLAKAYQSRDFSKLASTQRELKAYVGYAFEELPPAIQFSVIAFGNNSGDPFYTGHWFCGDFESIRWVLTRAGFTDVQRVAEKESRHPKLLSRYADTEAPEQVIVEAVKPGADGVEAMKA